MPCQAHKYFEKCYLKISNYCLVFRNTRGEILLELRARSLLLLSSEGVIASEFSYANFNKMVIYTCLYLQLLKIAFHCKHTCCAFNERYK
jgi:hypothetical protein